jgi:putative methionine-R-sulfoxide reductase with GAF domain
MNIKAVILTELEHEITAIKTFDDRIDLIATYAKKYTEAERCSIFVYKEETNQLQSIYSDGIPVLTINSNTGLVGYAFHKRETIVENNVASSRYFFKEFDKKSGYKTQAILAVPIINANKKRLGVIQLLNKPDGFNEWDIKFTESVSECLIPLLDSTIPSVNKNNQSDILASGTPQEKFDNYLKDKKLYLMEDENAYYKILEMKREYYIGADKCYLLDESPKEIPIFYYNTNEEFLSVDMHVKIDRNANGIFIREFNHDDHFSYYGFEKDD